MLQDQLVGIRLVLTVGDVHLKFVCLKRTKAIIDKHPSLAPFCCLGMKGPANAVPLSPQTLWGTGLSVANVLGLSGPCSPHKLWNAFLLPAGGESLLKVSLF